MTAAALCPSGRPAYDLDNVFETLAPVAAAYAIGSLPLSWLVARRHGVDLHAAGSGSVGATNVLRTAGVPAGVLALVLDAAKGFVAMMCVSGLSATPTATVVAAVAAVLGHVYPAWLGFRGGKGVATGAGVFAVLAPGALAVAVAVFGVTVAATRYVSLGSSLAALTLVFAVASFEAPPRVVAAAVAVAAIVLERHRTNFMRLLAGTERRVGFRAAH